MVLAAPEEMVVTLTPSKVQAPVAHPVIVGAAMLIALMALVPAPEVLTVVAILMPLVIELPLVLVEASVKVREW